VAGAVPTFRLRPCGLKLSKLGLRHGAQARLRVLGKAGEHHRDVVARMLVAATGDHYACAMNRPAPQGRLQRHGHLGPCGERRRAAKLDPILVDNEAIGGEGQPCLPRLDGNLVNGARMINLSRAHMCISIIAQAQ